MGRRLLGVILGLCVWLGVFCDFWPLFALVLSLTVGMAEARSRSDLWEETLIRESPLSLLTGT